MVIPNASGRKYEAGPSGVNKFEENHVQNMEYEQSGLLFNNSHACGLALDPMPHFAPHSFWTLQPPLNFGTELPMIHMPELSEIMQPQPQIQALPQSTFCNGSESIGKLISIQTPSKFAGCEVAVVGSWDNWQTMEHLQHYGNHLIGSKVLPFGLHYCRFIVNGALTPADDLPWVHDDVGNYYNVLNFQEDAPVMHANEPAELAKAPAFSSEHEYPPPSPPSSYDNKHFNENDFFDEKGSFRQPPEIPPQLEAALLQIPSSSTDTSQTVPRPHFTQLDHLFNLKTDDHYVGFSSIQRFPDKYVTGVLYKDLPKPK